MKNMLSLFLMIFLVFAFGSCEKQNVPSKKPKAEKITPGVEKGEKKEGGEVKPVEPEQYIYDARGRRDPFLSLVETTRQKLTKKKGASPFESYDIDEIKLLAIAWNKNNKYFAHIMLPDKKTYTITEGMTLGLQGGKVVKITKDTVVVREFIKDYRGAIKPRDSILKLHKGEEE